MEVIFQNLCLRVVESELLQESLTVLDCRKSEL